jgi:predicted aspartyl protease
MRLSAALTFLCCYTLALDAADRTRFRLRGAADIVVEVSIGGEGPFRFLLDTGSSRSAIAAAAASRLRQPRVARTLMLTPSGQSLRDLTRLHLTIGPAADIEVEALILGSDELGAGVDGLLGQDVLRSLTYTIDYERREIVWHDAAPAARGTRIALEEDEGRLIALLPQAAGPCGTLRVIPDSGADAWVLFERSGRALPAFTPAAAARLRTMTGQRSVRSVVIDQIEVGRLELRNQVAVVIDATHAGSIFGDGLLPLHVFTRVTFNGRAGYMEVEVAR